jgi:uncharacterized protein YjbI with pentapeptide repeats/ABC-type branched-subunit amino acid transport system substrate-binding protein
MKSQSRKDPAMTFWNRIRGYLYLVPPIILFLGGLIGLGRAIYHVIPPSTPYLMEYLKGFILLPVIGAIAAAIWWIVLTRRDKKLLDKTFMGLSLASIVGLGIAVGLWGLYQRSCLTNLEPMRDYYNCNFSDKDLSQSDIHGSDLTQAVLEGADLSGANLTQVDLRNQDLRGGRLAGAILSGANLVGIDLTGADLSRVTAVEADLTNADLSSVDLQNCDLSQANLENASLTGAKFNDCDLSGADFSDLDLSEAFLTGADLSAAILRGAHLEGADLQNVIFDEADFTDAHLTGAVLSGSSLKGALLDGADFTEVDFGGANLAQMKASKADFSSADLRGVNLKQADLSESILNRCDMRETTLDRTNLRDANLEGANLSGASLLSVELEGAVLVGANLSSAGLDQLDLKSTDLSQADLSGADLTNSDLSGGEYQGMNLQGADLSGSDLSEATFLECTFASSNLSGANLLDANLSGNDFSHADFTGAALSGTRLTEANLEEAYCGGLDLHTASLSDTHMAGINLEGANLSGRHLSGIDFGEANLSNANLQSSDLSGANLSETDLKGTNLKYSNLGGADLSGQDITRVEIAGAYLQGANFSSANLSGLNLHGVNLGQADLSNAKLTETVLQSANLEDADLSRTVLNGADLRLVNFQGANFQGASLEGALLTYSDFYGATGLTSEMLDTALGLVNGTYFQPREEVISALSGVCQRTGVPEAAAYKGVLGLQPSVLLSNTGDSHEWSDSIPSEWEPTGIHFAQLVVCVQPQQTYVISSTPYCLGTSYCSDPTYLQRHSYRVDVEIRRAREGTLVTSQTFYGSPPRAAQNTESWSIVNSGLWGSKVTYASIEAWLKGYIAPRSYTCEDELGCVDVVPGAPIEIGAIFALSDIYGYLGEDTLRGMEIASEDMGDILGHPIRLIELDSSCAEDQGAAMAARLVENQWIIGAIGTTCGAPTYAAATVLSDEGMVMISPSISTAWLTDPEYRQAGFLRVIPNDLEQAELVAEFAYKELGARRMATIHQGLTFGGDLAAKACEVFTSLGGECVIQQECVEGVTDVRELLNDVTAETPDVIFLPVLMEVGVEILRQARGMDALDEVSMVATDALFSNYILEVAGDASKDLYISGLMIGSDYYTQAYEQFLEKYIEKYGTEPQGLFHAYGYDALLFLARTIEKTAVKDPDGTLHIPRQALRDALFSTHYLQVLTGNLNCTTEGDCGSTNAIRILQVVDSDPSTYHPGADEDSNPKVVYP